MMNALEKAAAYDMMYEADYNVFEEDEVDTTLDTWEGNIEIEEEEEY